MTSEDPVVAPGAHEDPDAHALYVATAVCARGLRTARPFGRGDIVCAIPCTARHDRPARYTVQVDETTHIEVGPLTSLNHSCEPNIFLDTSRMLVIAARDLAAHEELTFFYPSTEWDMAAPFDCTCGSARCLGTIRGARHVPSDILAGYFVNPHIRRMKDAPS